MNKSKLPLTDTAEKNVWISRKEIEHILDGQDHRKSIVWPMLHTYIHKAAEEYSERLKIQEQINCC